MASQKDYESAIVDPNSRQRFLDLLDLSEIKPHVRKVVYYPQGHYFYFNRKDYYDAEKMIMSTRRSIPSLFGINVRLKINVYANAFSLEQHPLLGDFLSSLIDHEAFHAKEIYEKDPKVKFPWRGLFSMKSSDWEILFWRQDIRALDNQLKNFKKRNVSREYVEGILQRKLDLEGVVNPEKGPEVLREEIERLLF
ncbi:MAG: hypothetical protein PHF67_03715 [Candidatus Nanoarchaeia archaeon]|nr:hypothetical protein [Candidatus Nanoarchaeia archaeon]